MGRDIVLRAVDDKGNVLFEYGVPFAVGRTVKQFMEEAFVLNQEAQPNADPFLYILEYYGYSEAPQFPGYLGYEVEGIGLKSTGILPSNDQYYWELKINDQPANAGADSLCPGPDSIVVWEYKDISASATRVPARTELIRARRLARHSGRGSRK